MKSKKKTVVKKRKSFTAPSFVQITTTSGIRGDAVYALDRDGLVWVSYMNHRPWNGWEPVSNRAYE